MKGRVLAYRGSHRTQNPKQMIIQPEGVDTKEQASKLVGKTVTWTSQAGKKIQGKIRAPHGGKGAVRVLFSEKGLPGQVLGSDVEIA